MTDQYSNKTDRWSSLMSAQSGTGRTLYGFWLSPYMSQVAHILAEGGLGFGYERVSPYQGSTHSPEHRARNSLAKIPALRDTNGAVIAESQAICRYLARMYPEVRRFYPIDDPVRCAQVDTKNDFITFSIGGPFFNWFAFSAYLPKAWGLKVENEAHIYSLCSALLVKGELARLVAGSDMAPFVLGNEPFLPDFQLFHTLELSRTFSKLFEMPMLNLVRGDRALQIFHNAMSERSATREILNAQASEIPISKKELFEEFGQACSKMIDKRTLEELFGHEV